jgi:hypothetical protein
MSPEKRQKKKKERRATFFLLEHDRKGSHINTQTHKDRKTKREIKKEQ